MQLRADNTFSLPKQNHILLNQAKFQYDNQNMQNKIALKS